MANFHEEDNIMRPKKKFDDIIEEINVELDKAHRAYEHGHYHIDDREFKQFKKGWFYHNWAHRFRRLGNVGVIAIPNTSLEEWIYWLYEWSQAFVDDYNKFKDLVFEAIKLHEEHLNILDSQVEDLKDRVEEIERQLVLIWEEIRKLVEEITKIKTEVNHIKNDITNIYNEINNLHESDNNLQNQIDSMKQNIFNVSLPNKIHGTLRNGWTMKHESAQEEFSLIWGWNNEEDHTQGVHWQLVLNYLYKDNADFQGVLNNDSLIGIIPNIPEDRWKIGETWLYAGYVAQSAMLVGVSYIHLVPVGGSLEVRITNTTRSGVAPTNQNWQLNTGGAPVNYIS